MAQYNNANLVFKYGDDVAYIKGLSAADVQKLTADHNTLTTVDGKVTTIEGQVSTITTTTIPAIEGRLDTVEQEIEDITADVTSITIAAAAPENPSTLENKEGVIYPADNLLNW